MLVQMLPVDLLLNLLSNTTLPLAGITSRITVIQALVGSKLSFSDALFGISNCIAVLATGFW